MPEGRFLLPWEVVKSDDDVEYQVDMVLERARWAAGTFAGFDRARTLAIAKAVADAGAARASQYGDWAVRETGFGVAEHKAIKNEITTTGFYAHYKDRDFVGKRVRAKEKIVEIARPAGVVFALIPSTNPISTVNFKIMSAMMTRNAIVISPHPAAKECSVDAIEHLAEAAYKAGAPDGAIQVVREPNLAVIDCIMRSEKVDVILATGGSAMVRAAYSSGNPAIGVGPGNAPAFVDSSADLGKTAQRIIDSKSFDNSILCTNESVVIAEKAIADDLLRYMARAGAYLCTADERDRLRALLFHDNGFNIETLGKSAAWIAQKADISVPASTRVLLVPIDRIAREEPLSREKLCPVLGFFRASDRAHGIAVSRTMLRIIGGGHSAAIHSHDSATIMAFAASVRALRVVVNSPCSQGAAGFGTNLAPSFTIGTGYFGRSSVGENVGPEHLINWTRIAYNADAEEAFGDFTGLEPWSHVDESPPTLHAIPATGPTGGDVRDEIRRIVLEELRQMVGD
ncbi:MAG: aldehyde dehydrogenase family protein [Alphaproteobacteria bacterium]